MYIILLPLLPARAVSMPAAAHRAALCCQQSDLLEPSSSERMAMRTQMELKTNSLSKLSESFTKS